MTKPGPTGEYPDGKCRYDDDGELFAKVYSTDGLVYINFGQRVRWIAAPPNDIDDFCEILQKHASVARRQRGEESRQKDIKEGNSKGPTDRETGQDGSGPGDR